MEVGVRELRNHLSRYLDRVRDGEEVIVTDRGRAVARVVPVADERVLDRLMYGQQSLSPFLGRRDFELPALGRHGPDEGARIVSAMQCAVRR